MNFQIQYFYIYNIFINILKLDIISTIKNYKLEKN